MKLSKAFLYGIVAFVGYKLYKSHQATKIIAPIAEQPIAALVPSNVQIETQMTAVSPPMTGEVLQSQLSPTEITYGETFARFLH